MRKNVRVLCKYIWNLDSIVILGKATDLSVFYCKMVPSLNKVNIIAANKSV